MTHEADGSTCACIPGHRCLPCRRKGQLRTRLIIHKWMDDPTRGRRDRDEMTWQQQIDARDRAWTARDLYDIWRDRDRWATTWWREHWPEYWNRQTPIRERHVRPTSGQIVAWAIHHGRDITVGEKTSDGLPGAENVHACTAPLADCEQPTFIFARSLSPRLDPDELARPLTHYHRAEPQDEATVGAEELDLFSVSGVSA